MRLSTVECPEEPARRERNAFAQSFVGGSGAAVIRNVGFRVRVPLKRYQLAFVDVLSN